MIVRDLAGSTSRTESIVLHHHACPAVALAKEDLFPVAARALRYGLANGSDLTLRFGFRRGPRAAHRKPLTMHQRRGLNRVRRRADAERRGLRSRSILGCWLRFRRGSLSFAWPFPSLWSSSVTNSTDFLPPFGRGRIALPTFLT